MVINSACSDAVSVSALRFWMSSRYRCQVSSGGPRLISCKSRDSSPERCRVSEISAPRRCSCRVRLTYSVTSSPCWAARWRIRDSSSCVISIVSGMYSFYAIREGQEIASPAGPGILMIWPPLVGVLTVLRLPMLGDNHPSASFGATTPVGAPFSGHGRHWTRAVREGVPGRPAWPIAATASCGTAWSNTTCRGCASRPPRSPGRCASATRRTRSAKCWPHWSIKNNGVPNCA